MKGKLPAKAACSKPRDVLTLLPYELSVQCLRYLPLHSLLAVASTCRAWRRLVFNAELWYAQCRAHGYLGLIQTRYAKSDIRPCGLLVPLASTRDAELLSTKEPPRSPPTLAVHAETLVQGLGDHYTLTPTTQAYVDWANEFRYHYALETQWHKGRYTVRDLSGHKDVVLAVRVDPTRGFVYSGSRDGTAKVWNLHTHRCIKTLQGHSMAVSCLDVDASEGTMATGSWDGTVRVWALQESAEDASPSRLATQFVCAYILDQGDEVICLRLKGQELAAGTSLGLVQLWDTTTGDCKKVFNFAAEAADRGLDIGGDNTIVSCVDMDETFVYAGIGRSVAVLDRQRDRVLTHITMHSSPVTAIKLDARTFVSGAEDSSVLAWHRPRYPLSQLGSARATVPHCSHHSPTKPPESFLDHIEPHMLHGHFSGVRCLQTFGNRLCTGSYDTSIRVWSIERGQEKCLVKLKGHAGDVNAVDMTHDLVVSGSDDGLIKVWRFQTNACPPPPLLVDQGAVVAPNVPTGAKQTKVALANPNLTPSAKRAYSMFYQTLPASKRPRALSNSDTALAATTWWGAAYHVLTVAQAPLTCHAIYERILKDPALRQHFVNRGKTPINTLNQCLHQRTQGPCPQLLLVTQDRPHQFQLAP